MNIAVHIDRLILDGISAGHRERPLIQAAVEAELARLLAEGGLGQQWMSGGAAPSAPAGAIELRRGAEPAALGQQIAHAVYSRIGSER